MKSLAVFVGAGVLLVGAPGFLAPPPRPRVFLLDAGRVTSARQAIRENQPAVLPAWSALSREAGAALTVTRFSVVDKGVTPPSGDKHDYTSQAPYFWPNPATPGGLPYVRRDGERNPELNRITDHAAQDGLALPDPAPRGAALRRRGVRARDGEGPERGSLRPEPARRARRRAVSGCPRTGRRAGPPSVQAFVRARGGEGAAYVLVQASPAGLPANVNPGRCAECCCDERRRFLA
jgi:hypothetical protein